MPDTPADNGRVPLSDEERAVLVGSARCHFDEGCVVGCVADTAHNKVLKVAGGSVTTFAGTGTSGSTGDQGLATSATLNAPAAETPADF